jgi:hypothetical protein
MIRKSARIPHLILLASALGLATVAAAALKDKPPKGVALHGTGWLIDPYRSDDPDKEIEAAVKADRDQQNARTRDPMGRDRGGVMDDDGPLGRGYGDGTGGGGFPTGDRRRDDPVGRRDPTGSERGGWGTHTDRTSTDIDPTGQSGSITIGSRGGGGLRNEFIGQLTRNPEKLSFLEANQRLTVSEDKLETDCTPGTKEAISDSYGDGERRCGLDGRAWVIETTRGKKHFTRTDRFEVSKDGKTLNYVTTASGNGMPRIRISRTYTLAPPPPAAS